MLPIAPSSPWLISPRDDLLWLIGSCAFAFVAVGAFQLFQGPLQLGLATSVLILQAVWSLGFDGTHLFATYSRTLLDRSFRAQQRALLWSSAIVFAVGPVFVLGGYAALGEEGSRAASFAFNRFALTWAYYHVCRQHWGVAMLYRNKHGERDAWGRRLEAGLMTTGFAFPYIYATAHSGYALSPAELQWIGDGAWHWTAVGLGVAGAVSAAIALLAAQRADAAWNEIGRCARGIAIGALAIAAYLAASQWLGGSAILLQHAQQISGIAFAGCALLALGYAATRGGAWNRPKWLMIASALGTHNAIFLMSDLPPSIPILALTLFHNIQYHRIVRFHNRNHYASVNADEVGWAKRLTDDLVLFGGVALLYSVFYASVRVSPLQLTDELALYVASSFTWGFALHHYVLDAVIWRPSRSVRLQSDLRIAS